MNKYIIADIHGEYDKLVACLKSVNFDKEKDLLIQLGDVVDGGSGSYECIELLLSIKNSIFIRGNHDELWFKNIENPDNNFLWWQGARETYQSYLDNNVDPIIHESFFLKQREYYIDEDNNYFVHGGFNRHHSLESQEGSTVFSWDRDLLLQAMSYESMKDYEHPFRIVGNPKEVFLGHTPTTLWDITTPIKAANIWNLDTGSGKGGLLTIMNLETKEYNQF